MTEVGPRQFVDAYLRYLSIERQLSDHTISAYQRDLAKLLAFSDSKGLMLWQGLQPNVTRQFSAKLHAQGLTGKSIQRVLSAARGLCNFLIQHGQIASNPFNDVRAPKVDKRLPKTLTVDQIVSLVEIDTNDALSYRDKAILELFYSSGLRLAELCRLDLRDLDSGQLLLRVTGKGNKTREVPIGTKALEAVTAWLPHRALLPLRDVNAIFVSKLGKRISPRTVQSRVSYWAKRQGVEINVSPHVLRHSFASHMLESSGELRAVQELLGHANISTTQVYTHLDFQHLAQVYDNAHPRAKK